MANLTGKLTTSLEAGAVLIEKTITANGTYNASSDNADGYNHILVQVTTGGAVNPNYEWWANEDRTLVVRRKLFNSNNQYYRIQDAPYRIYFNWFDINTTSAPFQTLMNPPFITANEGGQGNFTMFVKSNTQVYAECDQTDYGGASDTHGYIGFYDNTIRGWTTGLTYNQVGKYRAIMESTDRGQVTNPTPWEEPTFDPING